MSFSFVSINIFSIFSSLSIPMVQIICLFIFLPSLIFVFYIFTFPSEQHCFFIPFFLKNFESCFQYLLSLSLSLYIYIYIYIYIFLPFSLPLCLLPQSPFLFLPSLPLPILPFLLPLYFSLSPSFSLSLYLSLSLFLPLPTLSHPPLSSSFSLFLPFRSPLSLSLFSYLPSPSSLPLTIPLSLPSLLLHIPSPSMSLPALSPLSLYPVLLDWSLLFWLLLYALYHTFFFSLHFPPIFEPSLQVIK